MDCMLGVDWHARAHTTAPQQAHARARLCMHMPGRQCISSSDVWVSAAGCTCQGQASAPAVQHDALGAGDCQWRLGRHRGSDTRHCSMQRGRVREHLRDQPRRLGLRSAELARGQRQLTRDTCGNEDTRSSASCQWTPLPIPSTASATSSCSSSGDPKLCAVSCGRQEALRPCPTMPGRRCSVPMSAAIARSTSLTQKEASALQYLLSRTKIAHQGHLSITRWQATLRPSAGHMQQWAVRHTPDVCSCDHVHACADAGACPRT